MHFPCVGVTIWGMNRCEVIDPATGEVFFDKLGIETAVDLTELYWIYDEAR